jgi:hypothetical protein
VRRLHGETLVESFVNMGSETKRAANFLRRWYAYTKRSAKRGRVKRPHKKFGSANLIIDSSKVALNLRARRIYKSLRGKVIWWSLVISQEFRIVILRQEDIL